MNSNYKIILSILLGVILIVLLAGYFLWPAAVTDTDPQISDQVPPVSNQVPPVTNQVSPELRMNQKKTADIAVDLTRFVYNALQPDQGIAHPVFVCDRAARKCSPDLESTTPHFGYSIMSLKRASSTIPSFGLKADAMMNLILDKCSTNTKYCEWNFFPLYEYYIETKDIRYYNAMVSIGDLLLAKESSPDLFSTNTPVKWWRLYDVTKDERYKEALIATANKIIDDNFKSLASPSNELYRTENLVVYEDMIEVVWNTMVPAYRVSGDKKYLEFAQKFINEAEIENNVRNIWEQPGTPGAGTLVKGMETILWLSQQDPEHKDENTERLTKISEQIISLYWDVPERVFINGDYGLLTRVNYKTTNIQAWLAVVIGQIEVDTLTVPWQK